MRRISGRMRFSFTRLPSLRRCQVICRTPKIGVSRNCSSIRRIRPRFCSVYIDYEAMGRDLERGGDVFTIESSYLEVHIFWNN